MTTNRLKYGIVAHPAQHSLSPAMFNAAFKELKMDAVYEVFDIEPGNFEKFAKEELRKLNGVSVSLPYKEKIIEYLDEIDEDAKGIGAVNTVLNRDRRLIGYNTDFSGFIKALKEKTSDLKSGLKSSESGLKGKKVIVLGAGGAAKAVIYGLLKEKAEVIILNRSLENAKKVSEYFEKQFKKFSVEIPCFELGKLPEKECDILVQTTSAWLTKGLDAKLLPENYFKNLKNLKSKPVVFDIVYKPLMTPLLEKAKENSCEIITGEKMLLNQAIEQFEIFTGEKAPVEVIKKALKKALEEGLS